MPWLPSDALEHTQAADTPHLQWLWARAANAARKRGLTDADAIREADSVVNRVKAARKE